MNDRAAALMAGSFAAPRTIGDRDRILPVDAIEIDRRFVADLPVRPECATVVSTIVARPNALCLRTTSEATETAEQVHRLSEQGCALMQGFLFPRPLLADEFMGLAGSFGGASIRAGVGRFDLSERASVRRQP